MVWRDQWRDGRFCPFAGESGLSTHQLRKPLLASGLMAEGVGFEPTEPVRVLLISSQVPLTTQPPFRYLDFVMF